MFMTPTGFIILLVLGLLGLWIIVEIGGLPGKKAHQRNHPQAEAINVLGWLGLLSGGVGWVVALVWAYMKPVFAPVELRAAASEHRPGGEPGEPEEVS